jgi:hypothetical protein
MSAGFELRYHPQAALKLFCAKGYNSTTMDS